jgi:hypothetical protein
MFSLWNETFGVSPTFANKLGLLTFNFLAFGPPLLVCFFYTARPLRFGLGVLAMLLIGGAFSERERGDLMLRADRSYFGILHVYESALRDEDGRIKLDANNHPAESYTYLMHGTTHHGLNYQNPPELRRIATTYYHRFGPTGIIMEPINWFPLAREDYAKIGTYKLTDAAFAALTAAQVPDAVLTKLNPLKTRDFFKSRGEFSDEIGRLLTKDEAEKYRTDIIDLSKRGWSWHPYWSDARLPAALVGSGVPSLGVNLPLGQLVGAKSEPPYATVGFGTGTMASYGRPFQHVVFYEIDDHIRSFSFQDHTWPSGKVAPYFNYGQDAQRRGVQLEVIMGDARQTLQREEPELSCYKFVRWTQAKDGAWQKQEDPTPSCLFPKRDNYYRAMELDAFSSDAIPVHLIVKESIATYMRKLIKPRLRAEPLKDQNGKILKRYYDGGILLVHTSNRHVDLASPVTDVVEELNKEWKTELDREGLRLAWRVAHDGYKGESLPANPRDPDLGRFQSSYVMVAWHEENLPPTMTDQEAGQAEQAGRVGWTTPRAPGMRVWTDDYSNLLSVFRW